jgi:hypothetical protein
MFTKLIYNEHLPFMIRSEYEAKITDGRPGDTCQSPHLFKAFETITRLETWCENEKLCGQQNGEGVLDLILPPPHAGCRLFRTRRPRYSGRNTLSELED